MTGFAIAGTDANFKEEVLESSKVVVVDFWAPWCGPCKAIAPMLDELAATRDDLKIVKVNVDEEKLTASAYGIRSIPTMMMFKDGALVATKVGAGPRSTLDAWIAENM